MFIIGEALIEEPVAHARFACDLQHCKGACCTMPGARGAPLEDSEVAEIERAYPAVRKYLPEKNLLAIARHGAVEGVPGNYATTCVDDRDCVFVYHEQGIAKCSLEKAFLNGETEWRKPISCHLFPIRISSEGIDRLRYEKISECVAGRANGEKNEIPLAVYLREPLVRKFGREWYDRFLAEVQRRDGLPE